jgi:[ribosomal protein S5]-alanine N-acetyltransferase
MARDAQDSPAPEAPAIVLATPRLILRRFTLDDAPFILELLNDPGWLEFIGDKGVRNLEDARDYLRRGPIAMYEREGFGLFMVERREGGLPIGMCGLIKRDALPDVDIGYAFLPDHRTRGYAREAAAAILDYGQRTVGLKRIVAITAPANARSSALLEKLGMKREKTVKLDGDEVRLYAVDFRPA